MGRNNEIAKLADQHQYFSEPMPEGAKSGPAVTLLNATPDPLGSVAALCAMYTGRVVRNLNELTVDERIAALDQMLRTELNGALEAVKFHFLIEGVGRDFTHQAVRGRAAFYAQESLRFAVKEDWRDEIPLPPSLASLPEDHWRVKEWHRAIGAIDDAYTAMVHDGVPAEDARKLLPHAVTTRYHWIVDLRELLKVAGLRTCTQAQFEWRLVIARVAEALRKYGSYRLGDNWQFKYIANKLRPYCYQKERCGFMAEFDRSCKIRERVELNARAGRPSSEWGMPAEGIPAIRDEEWLTDPSAARK